MLAGRLLSSFHASSSATGCRAPSQRHKSMSRHQCACRAAPPAQFFTHSAALGDMGPPFAAAQQCRSLPAAERETGDQQALEQEGSAPSGSDAAAPPLLEEQLPLLGRLLIRPLQAGDVGAASVVLTRAFATSPQGIPLNDGRSYCEQCLTHAPRGVLLVARLEPTDASLLRPGQQSWVVATTSLSFTRDTREEFPSLQPPDEAPYLSNMAVDPRFRRQGLAKRMLAACEQYCTTRGLRTIYLHVRLSDEPGQALYRSCGYEELERDSWLVKLRSITPRALLRKDVA